MSPKKSIPTKAELIQLQKIYKTDERIGEYLGGVPAYLVAYWRRKKNVPRHSVPKFSEKEIRDLWERFGDDDRCGLELGISKAAFYNWRRRYNIREKPAFLKLEQLELDFPGLKLKRQLDSLYGKQTAAQKILSRTSTGEKVEVGQTIEIEPDLVVAGADISDLIERFKETNTEYVWNPNKLVIGLTEAEDRRHDQGVNGFQSIREFVRRQNVRFFFDSRDGDPCQIVIERGLAVPGSLALGSNQNTAGYGCLSSMPLQIDSDKIASVWSTGRFETTVPATVKIEISGRRSRGVYTRDVAFSVTSQLANDGAAGRAIEFAGSVVSHMNISERFALANSARDLKALVAMTPYDSVVRRFLTGRAPADQIAILSDKDAVYEGIYKVNIEQLVPQIAGPDSVQQIRPVAELENTPVYQIVIGTCTNGRFDDLRIAAEVLKGRQVHRDCRLIVAPASRQVMLEGLKKGIIRVLVEAGAIVVNPGAGNTYGSPSGIFVKGERTLTTANGAFLADGKADGSEVYLCSPATAAASALNAAITDPARFVK